MGRFLPVVRVDFDGGWLIRVSGLVEKRKARREGQVPGTKNEKRDERHLSIFDEPSGCVFVG